MSYYCEKLSGARLQQCYDLAPARVKKYLEAEIEFLLGRIDSNDLVLELGCGYGRVTHALAAKARKVVGVDTALDSLFHARGFLPTEPTAHYLAMDALHLGFRAATFDVVACIQNGICAFGVDQKELLREAVRVTKPGGRIYFSSYLPRFWRHRLEWFELQSRQGLVGEIDYDLTGDNVIVCKDGFRASAMGVSEYDSLCSDLKLKPRFTEVDDSCLYCEVPVSA